MYYNNRSEIADIYELSSHSVWIAQDTRKRWERKNSLISILGSNQKLSVTKHFTGPIVT